MRLGPTGKIVLSSALITFDGSASTLALQAIADELTLPIASLQLINSAPLLMMAALLVPAGALADRIGRARALRWGLIVFAIGSLASALSGSAVQLIVARLTQGAGASAVLPAALALLPAVETRSSDNTRTLGTWASWTGAAAVAGPLLSGLIVDLWSWRGVYALSAALALVAATRSNHESPSAGRGAPVPTAATAALVAGLAALAYLASQAPNRSLGGLQVAALVLFIAFNAWVIARDPASEALFPREIRTARICIAANIATFALYFGMFGLPFLLVLYMQQILSYSALRAAFIILPISVMLLLAKRLARMTSSMSASAVTCAGTLFVSGGIAWVGVDADHLARWPDLVAGAALLGFGISLTVTPVTSAAIGDVPDTHTGLASGLNHAVVRFAGLTAVAVLGSVASPGSSVRVTSEGVRLALMICAGAVGLIGIAASAMLGRDRQPGKL